MNKVWFLKTRGAGTPWYVMVAPDRETAWKLAQEKWREKYGSGNIGSSLNWRTDQYTEGNSIEDVKDTGIAASLEGTIRNIIDVANDM